MREIIIEGPVIKKMKDLTNNYKDTENGGFIIGRLNPSKVYIADVTDAGELATRSFSHVVLDNNTLLSDINEYLKEDLFVIGTWHSHPKGYNLLPSSVDLDTMVKINSYYDINYLPVFSIVNYNKFNDFNMSFYEIDGSGEASKLNYRLKKVE